MAKASQFFTLATPSASTPPSSSGGYKFSQLDDLPEGIPVGELDCEGTMLERLWKQFELDPEMKKLFGFYAASGCELDALLADIIDRRWVYGANAALDLLAEEVDLTRGGLGDDALRVAIVLAHAATLADGTGEDLIEIVAGLSQGRPLSYQESYPAGIKIVTQGFSSEEFDMLLTLIPRVKPGGVGLTVSDALRDSGSFDSSTGSPTPLGFFTSSTGDPNPLFSPFTHGRSI